MVYELRNTKKVAPLFEGWQETLIWSCLQGIMGKIYVDSLEHPVSAMAVLGDFCFLAGKPDREFVLSEQSEGRQGFMIMVPGDRAWEPVIEGGLGRQAKKVVRYAIKKEPGIFDAEKLQAIVEGLPDGYTLQMMDEKLFQYCRGRSWCKDFALQYENYTLYSKYGLGAIVLKDGIPVSGASSYSGYIGGIEIEVGTREDHRRRGLASVCGAKLILECLERGWYPSWDAQNRWSVGLAEKLGYHFDREYTAYEVVREK